MTFQIVIDNLPHTVPVQPATQSIHGHTLVWHLSGTQPAAGSVWNGNIIWQWPSP